ncbi:MAG: cytochrome P450 [Caldilineaceae bacterium]|nr:cytochrome P450 [Caldilineaceae bacterium]HRJ43615.1 cytochrome P450 [Caldilineaceae bacterium]
MPSLPTLSGLPGLAVLRAMGRDRSLLAGLAAMHKHLGNAFQITLPGFKPIVFVGPESNRHILVSNRDDFLWRTEGDPVTALLRHGLLVEDGESHDCLRGLMEPTLQRAQVNGHIDGFWSCTGAVTDSWADGSAVDMLVEMRKVALLILMETLFAVDFRPDLARLWRPILRSIEYISPGAWLVWPGAPRPGFQKDLAELDDYLYGIIQARRASYTKTGTLGDDLLSVLVGHSQTHPEMNDDLIRDQLLTMLIAGHDTSTALLAWALYLLGTHPDALNEASNEARRVLTDDLPTPEQLRELTFLDTILKETLRLYPPIHVGNRRAAGDVEVEGYPVPKDNRVMYSIYLTHRDPAHWDDPDTFCPARFDRAQTKSGPPAFAYLPFGGGPRNCIGATFAQVEAKAVLGKVLRDFDLELLSGRVHEHMGATLEPRPGVKMRVRRTTSIFWTEREQ